MTDGIEFGEIQHQQPRSALRPDQDPHFAVQAVGELSAGELPIFVDIDVMRDMEGHAQSNTSVELGGVMLGRQFQDQEGRPFVMVTDCLRAEHFEATKGSFKFTHETWQQISRQRDDYADEVQMVGWYHTHPDWGVFLSGMDLFICNNFFNRPLDIALVIDPCRDDRGWFQWQSDVPGQTRRTGGFYLFGSRFRGNEINYFANLYQGNSKMATDPRYNPLSAPGGQSIVHIHDQRTPVQNIAIMGMLTIQMLVLALIAWKMLAPNREHDARMAGIEKSMDTIADDRQAQVREEATLNVLDAWIQSAGGGDQMASKLARAQADNNKLLLEQEKSAVFEKSQKSSIQRLNNSKKQVEQSLSQAKVDLERSRKAYDALSKSKGTSVKSWMLTLGAILFAVFGAVAGFVVKHYLVSRQDPDEDRHDDDEYRRRPEIEPQSFAEAGEDEIELIDRDSADPTGENDEPRR